MNTDRGREVDAEPTRRQGPDIDFTPDPVFPAHPEFYRRVLHEWPSPVLVVDAAGNIVYGNRAIEHMGGWNVRGAVGRSVLDFVHPDEVARVGESFVALTQSEESDTFGEIPWASINTRLVAENGQVLPVVVTGAGGLADPAVGGIVYDVRPAHEQDILRRGLTGLAQGEPIDEILHLITDMVALPPLGLDAAVLAPKGDGTYRVIGATSDELEAILVDAVDPQPWNHAGREPICTMVSRFPGGVGEDLFAAGYREFWHVSPEPARGADAYRLVAAGALAAQPAAGQVDRLSRANELAGVVLLRARADAMLEHSATHDRLTQLPTAKVSTGGRANVWSRRNRPPRRCCSSTSTGSRRSTTPTGTQRATGSSRRSRTGWWRSPGPSTSSVASAATNSSSSSATAATAPQTAPGCR